MVLQAIHDPASPKKAGGAAVDLRSYFRQLERRFQVGLLLAFVIPFASLSAYFHFQFHVTLKETGKLNLAAIAESQRNTVDLFLQERLVNIFSLFRSAAFSLTPSQQQMDTLLRQLRQASDAFIDVGFLNQTGRQIGYAGPYPYLQNKDYSDQDWFVQLMTRQPNHCVSDIYLGFRNKLHFTIGARQVIDERPYVLRATLDPDKFYLFLMTINHGKGVESALINPQGRFQLADPRAHDPGSLSDYIPPADKASGAIAARKGGDAVLVAHAWLSEVHWALLVTEPLSLAYAQLYRARRIMWVSSTIILALVVAAIWLTTRTLIAKARENAEKRDELTGQLVHASKLASVGELATGVAHEINNPLAIIVATTGVIKDMLNPEFNLSWTPQQIVEELKAVETAVFRARGITQQLLDYGHKNQPQLVNANINAIVENVLGGFKERALALEDVVVLRDFDPELPEILVDADRIRQVFLNLINNAGDAIKGPGRITIATRHDDQAVRITVTDTGVGMDGEQIKKIFNPFYTTKEVGKGTGLGLSVSIGIVESMGGTIEVQSLPGAGSAFTVTLPNKQTKGVVDEQSDANQRRQRDAYRPAD
jgi:two-component system, NtrC family, sensor kinase